MAEFGTGFRITVSTGQLIRTADRVKSLVNVMRASYDEMNAIISETSYYWKGTAGDAKRKIYNEKKETAEEMLRYLSAYPADLLKMAGVYEESEKSNTQFAQSLSSDIIM